MELIIGCIGKPSAGKSTFFNAVTSGKAKTGNFPFTTIEPNEGISAYLVDCACKSLGKVDQCSPRYGKCVNGVRHVPIKLLDVAGLIPGASKGAGLGNKFLNDLSQAHVFLHVIDISGKTNEKGEETIGYDPINDAEWLRTEIHQWVFTNLYSKWDSIVRRHQATQSSLAATFSAQLSGYSASQSLINTVLTHLELKDPCDLREWDENQLHRLVSGFLNFRFPTLLVLNKADQPGDTDRNIERVIDQYGQDKCFVASAAAECFLLAATKQDFIRYEPGEMTYTTHQDDKTLKPLEKKIEKRLERISDMVLFRYGSTGVRAAINRAVEISNTIVVYPVKNLTSFVAHDGGVLGLALLMKRGSTVREVAAKMLKGSVEMKFSHAEAQDGRRLADDEPLEASCVVLKIVLDTIQ